MFEGQTQSTGIEPNYLKKKNLYHVMIRKREREAIINRLRRNAELPEDLRECLISLPKGMLELLARILNKELLEWEETIAEFILHKMRDKLVDLLEGPTLSGLDVITLFVFLLNRGGQQETLYREYYRVIQSKSKSWTYPVKVQLFTMFNFMIKKGHTFVFQDVEEFHASLHSNRFFATQLHFYNLIVRKHPNSHHMTTYLPHATLKRLSQQISCHFYSEDEKLTMMEILIQVLYASEQADLSKCFNVDKIFHAAEYLMAYCKRKKMLIDRSILLIYNINIDAGSHQLINHNCFKVLTFEMKNSENPAKLRSLMAELFLNAVFYYPQQTYYSFLKKKTELIFDNLQYILEEFSNTTEVEELALELLRLIFSFATQAQQQTCKNPISSYINSHQSFLRSLRFLKTFPQLLQEFPILKGQDLQ